MKLTLTPEQATDLLEILDKHPHNEVAQTLAARIEAGLSDHHAPGCRRHEQNGVCFCDDCAIDRAEYARSVRAVVRQHIHPDHGERIEGIA